MLCFVLSEICYNLEAQCRTQGCIHVQLAITLLALRPHVGTVLHVIPQSNP